MRGDKKLDKRFINALEVCLLGGRQICDTAKVCYEKHLIMCRKIRQVQVIEEYLGEP